MPLEIDVMWKKNLWTSRKNNISKSNGEATLCKFRRIKCLVIILKLKLLTHEATESKIERQPIKDLNPSNLNMNIIVKQPINIL